MADSLGDRMKAYEQRETDHRFMRFAPVVARMDGRGFSKWTKGLARPYDADLSRVMIEVTRRLVAETGARMGYTQSDEITLVLLVDDIDQSMMFDGKAQKLCSVLASMTTALFIVECIGKGSPELARRAMRAPHFDARVFQVPTRSEAANAVLWREQDAAKNAVSMAARSMFGHKELQGRSGSQLREMMETMGCGFEQHPAFFKRGTFLQTRRRLENISQEMPERTNVNRDGDTQVVRRSVEAVDMPSFSTVANREAVVFDGAEPEPNPTDANAQDPADIPSAY